MSALEALDAGRLRAALGDQRIGHALIVLEETASTNDVVWQMAAENDEGLAVFAERQTAGRGQYGRNWESAPRRGLWLSILLRPQLEVCESGKLTDMLAGTVATTIKESTGLAVAVKPPNDVYAGGRKIAGVLVDMRVEAEGRHAAIAGIGINVNHVLDDFPPTLRENAGSIAMATGAVLDREQLAIALLKNLDARYAAFGQALSPRRS